MLLDNLKYPFLILGLGFDKLHLDGKELAEIEVVVVKL